MHHDRKEITRLLPLPLAFACLLGALLWPHWRDALSEETYCEQSGAALTAAALAVSTLSEPVDCEESPYLCVDGISRYIARVYADLLGRWPDPTEIDVLRATYPQGLPDIQFAQELVASPEYRDQVVQNLTHRLLERPATPAEQDYWASYEHREITLGLLTSHEYAMRKGGTGKAFVTGVYQDLLGREVAPAELREALRQLATHGRTAVVQALYDSEEHHGEQVDGVYLALLRMPPTTADRAEWVRALTAGAPLDQIIKDIIASKEYAAAAVSRQAEPLAATANQAPCAFDDCIRAVNTTAARETNDLQEEFEAQQGANMTQECKDEKERIHRRFADAERSCRLCHPPCAQPHKYYGCVKDVHFLIRQEEVSEYEKRCPDISNDGTVGQQLRLFRIIWKHQTDLQLCLDKHGG